MSINMSMMLLLLALFTVTVQGNSNCAIGDSPVETSIIGKGLLREFGCDSSGNNSLSSFKFIKDGLRFSPQFPVFRKYGTCAALIIVPFSTPYVISYRQSPSPEFFKDIAPEEYRKFKNGGVANWPCDEAVPVRKVYLWMHRNEYINLVKQMVEGILLFRTPDCIRFPGPPTEFSRADLDKAIADEMLKTAVLNFLSGVAFRFKFCV